EPRRTHTATGCSGYLTQSSRASRCRRLARAAPWPASTSSATLRAATSSEPGSSRSSADAAELSHPSGTFAGWHYSSVPSLIGLVHPGYGVHDNLLSDPLMTRYTVVCGGTCAVTLDALTRLRDRAALACLSPTGIAPISRRSGPAGPSAVLSVG